MELFINIIHYCIYKADYKMYLLSNKLNSFVLIGIPAINYKNTYGLNKNNSLREQSISGSTGISFVGGADFFYGLQLKNK